MPESSDMNFEFPRMSTAMKKLITGYLVVFVLLIGTMVGLQLVSESGVGDLERKAAGVIGGAELSFNTVATANRILIPGKESVLIPISMATNQKQVTAADITVNVPSNLLTVASLTSGTFFDSGTTTYGTANNTVTLLITPAAGRIAVGATCDRCYLGTAPVPTPGQPTIAPCATSPAPKCYPKAINSNGIVANLTVQAKTNVVGHADLTFMPWNESNPAPTPPGTAVAAVDSDTDVIGTTTFSTANKMGICVAYDFDKNGITNVTDIARVSTIFNKHTGDAGFNSLYDANNDGAISVTDIAVVSTRFNTSCTP